jgi:hypothetical protein
VLRTEQRRRNEGKWDLVAGPERGIPATPRGCCRRSCKNADWFEPVRRTSDNPLGTPSVRIPLREPRRSGSAVESVPVGARWAPGAGPVQAFAAEEPALLPQPSATGPYPRSK